MPYLTNPEFALRHSRCEGGNLREAGAGFRQSGGPQRRPMSAVGRRSVRTVLRMVARDQLAGSIGPPASVTRPGASAASQEDGHGKPHLLLDEPSAILLVRGGGQPAQLLIANQHVVKQNREAVRILVVADVALLLVESNPLRDDLVNCPRAGIIEQSPGCRESPAY